ncbi:aminopeptidase P family protein [Desulforhopalus vacuolatus]|uniref:M24 family metallopeptidase n=1 Tax=Desulforhopalus vacuolatus TaxID=40414 RepID=UPI001962A906|nr:Xaa-Pro peptidase family protein [Desulforhopalus vacuolatus]MBM9518375.1 aminopeptidase P family protein [Desulforhopalus vacuolatus]
MNYNKRIEKIQASLRGKKLGGLLVAQPENRRYLSGFRGGDNGIQETSGILIIPSKGKPHLITDSRFELAAQQESPDFKVHVYRKRLPEFLKELLGELDITKLGFESGYTLYSFAKKLEETLKNVKLFPLTDTIENMRIIKDEEEIELLRKSVLLNEKVFEQVYGSMLECKTEVDVAIAVETTMRRMGAESPSFSTIVASGERGALPHAIPSTQKLQSGKSLTIDMGLILNGYCSDMTRTFCCGKPDETYMQIHRIVRKAQLAGMEAIRAGVTGASVDKTARKVIEDAGYGKYFGHGLGHGVGLAVHEEPRLSRLNNKKLKAGMIVTVEPGIYIPEWGGIRIEDMVVVREDGCERLNTNDTWLNV